jgi:hypothetical protein
MESRAARTQPFCPNRRSGDEDGVYATCKAKRCSEYTQKLGVLPEISFVVAGGWSWVKKGSFTPQAS